jgi:hypothetical protein
MNTKRYNRKTKNKRNKKTRRRGGATQSSIMERFAGIFSLGEPEPVLSMKDSIFQFVEDVSLLGAAGIQASSNVVNASAELTRKMGIIIEYASYIASKSSVRIVGTVNVATNITFGTISLVGLAAAICITSTKKLLIKLNRLLEEDPKGLGIIMEQCRAATIAKSNTMTLYDTQYCIKRFLTYLDRVIKDKKNEIISSFDQIKHSLHVKRAQIKKLMLLVGCTKPRTWKLFGAKRYNCKNTESVTVKVELLKTPRLDSKFKNYIYLPDGPGNNKGVIENINLVQEYTRLKDLENTLSGIQELAFKIFSDEATKIINVVSTGASQPDPLPFVRDRIFVFEKIPHGANTLNNLTYELQHPFDEFALLLTQIYEHKKKVQPITPVEDKVAEEIITPEEEKDAKEKIGELMKNKEEELKDVEIAELNKEIDTLLNEDEKLENDKPVSLEELQNSLEEPVSSEESEKKHLENMLEESRRHNNSIHGGKSPWNIAKNTYKTIEKTSKYVGNTFDKKIGIPFDEGVLGINRSEPRSTVTSYGTFNPNEQMRIQINSMKYLNKTRLAKNYLNRQSKNRQNKKTSLPVISPSPSNQVQSTPKIQGSENEHLPAMYESMKSDFLNKNSKNKNSKKKNSKNEIIAETSNPMLNNMNIRESSVQPSPQPSQQKTGYSPPMFSSIDLSMFNPMSSFF